MHMINANMLFKANDVGVSVQEASKKMKWTADNLAPPPQWLIDMCEEATPRQAAVATPATDLDTEGAIARATEWLKEQPPAVEGTRNDTGYRVACKLKDFGVSEPVCASIMMQHWDCAPMVELEEIEHVASSAYSYGTAAPGAAHPMADFEVVGPEAGIHVSDNPFDVETPKKGKLYYLRPRDATPDLDKVELVQGYMDQQAMSVIYGASNTGKTFVARVVC